jgi:hypothetical protein
VEEFEKYLIQLGSATGVNLMRGAKRSMARDFRLTALDEEEAPGTSGGKRNVRLPRDQTQGVEARVVLEVSAGWASPSSHGPVGWRRSATLLLLSPLLEIETLRRSVKADRTPCQCSTQARGTA